MAMVLFRVRLRIRPELRDSVVKSVCRLMESTRGTKGCLDCNTYRDIEDEDTILYVEQWANQEELDEHLRTRNLKVLLAAVDLAVSPPDVRFDTICGTKGMDVIAAARLRDGQLEERKP
jgi:quinol monooxygenase YgiN